MKIILILGLIVGAITGLIGALFVGGLFLPRTHTATRSIRLGVPPEAAWNLIADRAGQAAWRTGLKSVERGADVNGHPVWREVDKRGDVMPIEIVESVTNSRLVGRIIDDGLPFGGTWTWQVTPDGAGCRVRITEDGFIKPPPFRYIARLIGYEVTINQYLRAMAAKFGQSASIDP